MGGPTKGFRVDPDKLSAVADRVKRLHDSVSLDMGRTGNVVDFQDSAKAEPPATERTVSLDGLRAVFAARWLKSTAAGQKRTQGELIGANQTDEKEAGEPLHVHVLRNASR